MKPFAVLLLLSTLWMAIVSATPEKFTSWFPITSQSMFAPISDRICNVTLAKYRDAVRQHNATSEVAAACAAQQKCILDNLDSDRGATMASANVLLGMTPSLLATLGPTVAEISLLSTERPLLSFLLSFGTPAVFQSRVFKYENPFDILDDKSYGILKISISVCQQSFISALQYLFTGLATANILYTAYQLSIRTLVTFRCVDTSLPIVWTVLPILIHIPAALALNLWIRWKTKDSNPRQCGLWQSVRKETDLCLDRNVRKVDRAAYSFTAMSLNYLATGAGFVHVTFGTLVFSSLAFIEVMDVVTVIARFMASALVCRAILNFELAGMRSSYAQKTDTYGEDGERLVNEGMVLEAGGW